MPLHRVGLTAVQDLIDVAISNIEGGAPPDGDTLNELLGKINARPFTIVSVAALKALSLAGIVDGQPAITLGWHGANDGGGLVWAWDADSEAAESTWCIVPDGHSGPGRWTAQGTTGVISARKWGMQASNPSYDIAPVMFDLWQEFRLSETQDNVLEKVLLIDPGKYYALTSIDWTGTGSTFSAWNANIYAHGVDIIGKCTGKPVIDMIGTRGIRLHGMSIVGDVSNKPSVPWLIGARASDACGPNYFKDCVTEGHFSKAAFANYASETTAFENCAFINQNSDPAAFAFIGDGRRLSGVTSDYATLRTPGEVASFSNNTYDNCRFYKAVAGDAILLDSAFGHTFRQGYCVSFAGSNFRIRCASGARTSGLRIENVLCETAQSPGVDYYITIECPDGDVSAIDGVTIDGGSPHAEKAIFNIVADAANAPMTSGGVKLTKANVLIRSSFSGTAKLFADTKANGDPLDYNPFTEFHGHIVAPSTMLNLNQPSKIYGTCLTTDVATLLSLPKLGSSLTVHDESGEVVHWGEWRQYGDWVANGGPRSFRRTLGGLAVDQVVEWDDEIRNNANLRVYRCVNGGATISNTTLPTHSNPNEVVVDANGIAWLHVGYQPTAAGANLTIDIRGPIINRKLRLANTDDPSKADRRINYGVGSPENRVTGSPGDEYWDANGPILQWTKATGAGTKTGWEPQPVVLYNSTTQVATPAASTAEHELFALTLPVLSASAELAFEFDAVHTGSGGTRTWKVKLGGTSILLPTASATTVPIFAMRGNLWANSSTSAQIAHAITGRGTDSLLAAINGTGSKDMTTPQVLSLTAQCASAADVMTLRRAKVTLLRP